MGWRLTGRAATGERSAVIYSSPGSWRRQGIKPLDSCKQAFTASRISCEANGLDSVLFARNGFAVSRTFHSGGAAGTAPAY